MEFFEKQSAEDPFFVKQLEDPSDVIGKAGYPISCVRWKLTGQIDKHGGSFRTSPDQSSQKLQLLWVLVEPVQSKSEILPETAI